MERGRCYRKSNFRIGGNPTGTLGCTPAGVSSLLLDIQKTVENGGVKLLTLARVKFHLVYWNRSNAIHWCIAEELWRTDWSRIVC